MCTSLSSVSLLCGFLSLGTLLTAFVSNVWIYTKEPVKLPSSDIQTTVLFRIGLWRVCPTYKRINSTIGKSQLESYQLDQTPRSFIFINDQAKRKYTYVAIPK
ncbi:uncharacterized protein LOC113466466 [Diaphorina citri]|uniref:Uncharacterized protein LOC113466466 n=1 Tax=Diaphorina citri TaxID=121845 RepID=A0A3Q0IN87_DIACI|nr:uncharacterized protein LOC113466466 [Diaphorina citri]XP_026677708.1 uncharacterized protein LOC113466466 [Diaphorina citri]